MWASAVIHVASKVFHTVMVLSMWYANRASSHAAVSSFHLAWSTLPILILNVDIANFRMLDADCELVLRFSSYALSCFALSVFFPSLFPLALLITSLFTQVPLTGRVHSHSHAKWFSFWRLMLSRLQLNISPKWKCSTVLFGKCSLKGIILKIKTNVWKSFLHLFMIKLGSLLNECCLTFCEELWGLLGVWL